MTFPGTSAFLACACLMSLAFAIQQERPACMETSSELCTADSAEALHMLQVKSGKTVEGVKRYAQWGQDKWLQDLYGDYKGFYLDIGSHDGEVLSNTQTLDELGWKGVCVDPLPNHMENRSCKVYKTVLTDKSSVSGDDTVTFHDCTFSGTDHGDGGLSGIKGLGAYVETDKRKDCSLIQLRTQRLDHFLKTVEDMPYAIDYMSLDVEGAEDMIMSYFPWETHCLKAITVERPSPAMVNLLFAHHCRLNAFLGQDHAYKCTCKNR
mmetsp:Transcript_36783/g.64794  ORF Transcript_36783/g.64794 Transcript_36783/m.64794 type:complete len:265 (+) Transcript_36783:84-878(+)